MIQYLMSFKTSIMKATIKELKDTLLNVDFNLIVNKNLLNNVEGIKLLCEIESQDMEVDFYISTRIGTSNRAAENFLIETKISNLAVNGS